MAYNEALADRIREAFRGRPGITEKAMFGGIAWLQGGKMLVGIVGNELMVRVGPEGHEDAVAQPHARTMEFTGRPMRGFVFVAAAGCRTVAQITAWIGRARPTSAPKRKTRLKAKP